MTQDQPLKNRIAFITGASRGIGRAAALYLAEQGAHIIALARTVSALESLDDEIKDKGGSATLIPQNLEELIKLDSLGPMLAEKFGALDIFIGNAGTLGPLTPLPHISEKDWMRVMTVNVTANFRLIRTLDPLLSASDQGRALFLTSDMAHLTEPYWGAYSTSKAALHTMVMTYAAEKKNTNLRVNLIQPGAVDTALLGQAFPGGYQGDMKSADDVAALIGDYCCAKNPEHGTTITF